MIVPGSNLLSDALECIDCETFQFYQYQAKTTNTIGLDVRTYAAPVTATGSIQPVDRSYYADAGLDFTKRHIEVWTETDTEDLYRARSGDQIGWEGERWEVVSETDWFPVDRWNSFVAVQVPTP